MVVVVGLWGVSAGSTVSCPIARGTAGSPALSRCVSTKLSKCRPQIGHSVAGCQSNVDPRCNCKPGPARFQSMPLWARCCSVTAKIKGRTKLFRHERRLSDTSQFQPDLVSSLLTTDELIHAGRWHNGIKNEYRKHLYTEKYYKSMTPEFSNCPHCCSMLLHWLISMHSAGYCNIT